MGILRPLTYSSFSAGVSLGWTHWGADCGVEIGLIRRAEGFLKEEREGSAGRNERVFGKGRG